MKRKNSVGTPASTRKAYAKPTLRTYGNLERITLNVGSKGSRDNGSMGDPVTARDATSTSSPRRPRRETIWVKIRAIASFRSHP
jgi:hypothetical protein